MDESEKKFLYYRIEALEEMIKALKEALRQERKDMLQNISALVQENKKLKKQLEICQKKK
jgi:regulator of replication initiation timing